MDTTKQKLKKIVENYISTFNADFEDFKRCLAITRSNLITQFGEMQKTNLVEQFLGQKPELLEAMIQAQLTDEEKVWFRSKDGARWFFDAFPAFRVSIKASYSKNPTTGVIVK